MDFFSSHSLLTINEKDGPTYSGPAGESWIDITASSSDLAHKIQNWRISEENTQSDHNLILYSLWTNNNTPCTNNDNHHTRKFATQVGNWSLFQQNITQHKQKRDDLVTTSAKKEQLDKAITTIWNDLEGINKVSFPPFSLKFKYVPCWSPQLNTLRK